MSGADRGLIAPMLAPLGAPPEGESSGSWAAENKYDGCRLLASAGGDHRGVVGFSGAHESGDNGEQFAMDGSFEISGLEGGDSPGRSLAWRPQESAQAEGLDIGMRVGVDVADLNLVGVDGGVIRDEREGGGH